MPIRDYYVGVIDRIMHARQIQPMRKPSFFVLPDATFAQVVQNTYWYTHLGDTQPHYRYGRYSNVLARCIKSKRREAHVDIGCGAGVFSWVFLDWAQQHGIPYNNVDLYGYDQCQEMISLSQMIRTGLKPHVPTYPPLQYHYDIGTFINSVSTGRRNDTHYTITFGHVLAQSHDPRAIQDFTRIILNVLKSLGPMCSCRLIAVDARGWHSEFLEGWAQLLGCLTHAGVTYNLVDSSDTVRVAQLVPSVPRT